MRYNEMSEAQKRVLLEEIEDMLEQIDLAQCEFGAGTTYGRCVFPGYSTVGQKQSSETQEEQAS